MAPADRIKITLRSTGDGDYWIATGLPAGGGEGTTGPAGPEGPAGPQGPAGDAGAAGAQGPAGSPGAPGAPGPQGPAGADSTVPGPQGPAGNPGAQGDTGPQGIQGVPGNDGATGSPGPTSPIFVALLTDASGALTNAPSGGTEPASGASRRIVDLRGVTNAVVMANMSAALAATGALKVQYSANGGVAWSDLAQVTGITTGALLVGTPTAVSAGAKISNAWLRVLVTGDGVADPNIRFAAVTFQPA